MSRADERTHRLVLPLAVSLLTVALGGCPKGEPPRVPFEGGQSTGASSGAGTTLSPEDTTAGPPATTDSGEDTTTQGADASSSGGRPAEPGIHWVGRWDETDPAARRAGWSGAGLVIRFDGTGVSVDLEDQARYFTVLVDGALQPPLATTPGRPQTVVLAADLPPGEHTIEMYRRTEGSFGATVIHGVEIEGELLAPPVVTRRMEVIGDSITAGYGNEGTAPCSFSAETENHYRTYGAVAAQTVGAEVHTVAWSGKGIIYNYGDDVTEPLPEVYDRTIASDRSSWGFAWQPDVVVVNLGTNDFSTDNDPSQQLYVDSYVQFLVHLRDVYPQAFMLVVSPSLFGDEAAIVDGYLLDVVAQRHAAGDPQVAFANINVEWIGSGCDGHPNVVTHEAMGARLVEELELHLGW